jgi:hypothetical protein
MINSVSFLVMLPSIAGKQLVARIQRRARKRAVSKTGRGQHGTVHPPTVEWGAPAKIAAFQFQVFASSPGPNETRYPFWQETEYGAECPRR